MLGNKSRWVERGNDMKNNFKNKKARMSAKAVKMADIAKRNAIGVRLMVEEMIEMQDRLEADWQGYLELSREGEDIDLDACQDMIGNNYVNEKNYIYGKYVQRGLPEELAEDIADYPECYIDEDGNVTLK